MVSIEQIRQPIAAEFLHYEQVFEQALETGNNPLLKDVLSLILARRGKQLRPTLVLLSAKLAGQVNEKTYQTAVALELLHTASLMHDDVVDGSETRRGLPSVHARWNNKVAVLAGDYLLSKVIEIISSLRNVRVLGIVADMGKSLAQGELLQLQSEGGLQTTEKEYFRIIGNKTARLFSACCEAGAVTVGATMRQETALTCFGEQLGICFQLQDDILDYSDSEELGKPTLGDIREGKATLPLIASMNRATLEEREHIRELASRPLTFDEEQEVRSFVLRYDGIRYARHKIEEHKEMAISALSVFRENPITQSLKVLLDYSVNRLH